MCRNLQLVPMFKDWNGKNKLCWYWSSFPFNFDNFENLSTFTKDFKFWFHNAYLSNPHLCKGFTPDDFVSLVPVPCGTCPDCMNNRAREIMFRIIQESKEHKSNYFVTLTYDDEHLPSNYSLVKDEISSFNKKLKVYLSRKGMKSDFRFYGVGEYGGESARPHYHVIYFGLEIDDLVFYKSTPEGNILYNSDFLSNVWQKGFVVIGEVTPNSAAYVARYTEKKKLLTKEEKKEFLDAGFTPEFSVQSMRPGIGANFFQKSVVSIKNQCYNISIKGKSYSIPKYYRDKIKKEFTDNPDWLSTYSRSLIDSFNSNLSKSVLYYGKDFYKVNSSDILNTLKLKKKRGL